MDDECERQQRDLECATALLETMSRQELVDMLRDTLFNESSDDTRKLSDWMAFQIIIQDETRAARELLADLGKVGAPNLCVLFESLTFTVELRGSRPLSLRKRERDNPGVNALTDLAQDGRGHHRLEISKACTTTLQSLTDSDHASQVFDDNHEDDTNSNDSFATCPEAKSVHSTPDLVTTNAGGSQPAQRISDGSWIIDGIQSLERFGKAKKYQASDKTKTLGTNRPLRGQKQRVSPMRRSPLDSSRDT